VNVGSVLAADLQMLESKKKKKKKTVGDPGKGAANTVSKPGFRLSGGLQSQPRTCTA